MRKRKPDWLLVLVGTLIGAAAGLFLALLEIPVHAYMAYGPAEFGDAGLYVDFCGSRWYTRTAPRPDDLRFEMYLWSLSPLLVVTPVGLFCGWFASRFVRPRTSVQFQTASTS